MQNSQQNQLLNKSSVVQEPLRWLFVAEFADGTILKQTQEDKSTTSENGSAFTDVMNSGKELVGFSLVQGQQHATVDLKTGAFVINRTPFIAHAQDFDPSMHKLELVYFRESLVDIMQGVGGSDVTRHYVNRYFIGWKCIDKFNKAHKAIIAVG